MIRTYCVRDVLAEAVERSSARGYGTSVWSIVKLSKLFEIGGPYTR